MRLIWHRLRRHDVSYRPTLAPIPAMWHNCSCGVGWLA